MNFPCEFLLSVDLEDVRDAVPNGDVSFKHVPVTTDRLLNFLREAGIKITFFVTGQLAQRYRTVVQNVLSEGHEIACHSFSHKLLAQYARVEFDDDIKRNLDALAQAGAERVHGFRAPFHSMTAQTTWAYPVLAQNGIRYSSSVLPGAHPLSGWPHFGERPKVMDGILEIPLSVVRFFGMRLPFASGLYLRVLPFALVKRRFLTLVKHGGPIVSYVHLLDFDQELKRLSLPIINQIPFVNFLMYYNRAGAFARLRTLLEVQNIRVLTYQEFFTRHATAFRVCSNHKIASFSDSIGSSLKPDFLTEHRVAGENPSSPVIAMNSHTVQLKD